MAEKKAYIYCGPDIKQAGLRQYQTFRGDPPEVVKKHIAESPAIRNLFVEPKDLRQMKNNINKQGTKENKLYKQAVDYVKQLEKGAES